MRYLTLIVALFCLLFSAESAFADKRIAFVVGNGAYKNVVQLPNPPMDAKAVAALLRNIGFEVIEGTNLDHKAMTDKLLDFGTKAQGADLAVFYYAGHGIAIGGTNYLLPVDSDVKSEMDVKLKYGINIDLTLDQTLSSAKVKLVLLDACRDDPFEASIKENSPTRGVTLNQGLAEMKSGEGTLIAFATSPGKTALDGPEGTHSPFTSALLAHLNEQGVELQQVMTEVRAEVNDQTHKQQLPWGNTNLTGAVYLNPAAAAPAASAKGPASGATAPAVASTSSGGIDVELEYWRSVKDSNKAEELNAYLTRYPEGQFKSLALARIAELQNGPTTTTRNLAAGVDPATFTDDATQLTEDQIGLNRDQRRDVQRRLTKLGFDTKVTGKFDDDTRDVIKRWQAARNYPSTGYLNRLQHKALLSEIVASAKTDDDNSSSSEERSSHHHGGSSGGGGRRYYRNNGGGGGNPGAVMGGFVGGMMGGMFRH
jgi:uncharacterized caspase-like protein